MPDDDGDDDPIAEEDDDNGVDIEEGVEVPGGDNDNDDDGDGHGDGHGNGHGDGHGVGHGDGAALEARPEVEPVPLPVLATHTPEAVADKPPAAPRVECRRSVKPSSAPIQCKTTIVIDVEDNPVPRPSPEVQGIMFKICVVCKLA